MKLQPADVLVKVSKGKDPFSVIKRWALGSPYEHISIYIGPVEILCDAIILKVPILCESIGRGVLLRSLSARYGDEVVVMRLKSEFDRRRIPQIIKEAVKLTGEDQAYYDYFCIVRFVLPRLIIQKFHLPLPIKYHRDIFMICSEAVFEVYYRAGLVDIILPGCIPPLPSDFVADSPLLEKVGRIVLSEGVV